jgi:hypothetical protein
MAKSYLTIAGLIAAVRAGEIDESKLIIVLDNDSTGFYLCAGTGEPDDDEQITVGSANGYYDVEPLYKFLFPTACVKWC